MIEMYIANWLVELVEHKSLVLMDTCRHYRFEGDICFTAGEMKGDQMANAK